MPGVPSAGDPVSLVDHRTQIGPRAQRIGSLRHRHHAGTSVEQRRQALGHQAPLLVERQHADFGTLALGDKLPGNDIGMVLHLADHDIVARPEKTFAPCIRHRIERRSSSGRENDLLPGFRTDVLGDTSPGSLVHLGSLLRKKMNPRWILAFDSRCRRSTVSITHSGFCAVAPLSR